MKSDETEFMEWKNRDNTMNSSSAKTVIQKLSKLHQEGKKVFLVFVNVSKRTIPRFGAPDYINIINGHKAYEYLSGRKSFYQDLLKTLSFTFREFKTYQDLVSILHASR